MSEQEPRAANGANSLKLVVRRTVAADPDFLFDAWTQPDQVRQWWGPRNVKCLAVEMDLRVGGTYRIGNELPDGTILWISGRYETIERPHKLVYTWKVEQNDGPAERVTVQFETTRGGTEIIIMHEHIQDFETRERHQDGWQGCLDGLEAALDQSRLRP